MKCNNIECCGLLKSNLKEVLPSGFFPAPCLVTYKNGQLKPQPWNEKNENAKFLPLFQRLSIKLSISYEPFTEMPYDYYCPTVHEQLSDRVCKTCGLYFASKKGAISHMKLVGHSIKKARQKRIIKSKSIIKTRGTEKLCILHDKNGEKNDSEWIESEDLEVDITASGDVSTESDEPCIPIISSLNEWLTNPFSTDEN